MRSLGAGLLVLSLLAGCQAQSQAPSPAPQFELKDLSGNPVSLSSFRGKVVMLDFWATWCGPCQISIPFVQKFYQTYKDQGLQVLGLNIDEDPSGVYAFVKQFGMTYPVLYAGGTPVPEIYNADGIPLFVFIDTEGRITRRYQGFHPKMVAEWEAEFLRLKTALKY